MLKRNKALLEFLRINNKIPNKKKNYKEE